MSKLGKSLYQNPLLFIGHTILWVLATFFVKYVISKKADFVGVSIVGLCFFGLCIIEIVTRNKPKKNFIIGSSIFCALYGFLGGIFYSLKQRMLDLYFSQGAAFLVIFLSAVVGVIWAILIGILRDKSAKAD